MPDVVAFLQNADWVTIAAVGAVALVGVRNLDLLKPVLEKAKSLLPTLSATTPDRSQAFAATQLLIAHFDKEGCKEGVEAAKLAGRCLFHSSEDHK